MIKTIHLTNFQSHIETALQLGPGLNVITGPSDSGKTAVIRALRWALYNEPRGDAFVRAGENSCEVTVTFAGGAAVIRSRKGRTNEYRVNSGSGELRFEAFGADPPPDVAQASGMPKITIGDREIPASFAYQLDGPFLLSESPLTAAKVLGKLAGTEEVDHAGRLVSVDLYRRHQDERRFATDVTALAEELHRYDGLPALKATLDQLSATTATARELKARLSSLTAFGTELRAVLERRAAAQARIAALYPALNAENSLGSLQSGFQRLVQLRTRAAALAGNAAQEADATATLLTATHALMAEAPTLAATAYQERFAALSAIRNRLVDAVGTERTTRVRLSVLSAVESAAPAARIAIAAVERLRALRPFSHSLAVNAAGHEEAATLFRRAMAVGRAEGPAHDATVAADRLAALRRWQAALAATNADFVVAAGQIAQLDRVRSAEKPVAQAVAIRADWLRLSDHRLRLSQLRANADEARGLTAVAAKAVRTHEQTYIAALVAIGQCPVCGSQVDPIRLREVLSA